jgi:hypothetical protein
VHARRDLCPSPPDVLLEIAPIQEERILGGHGLDPVQMPLQLPAGRGESERPAADERHQKSGKDVLQKFFHVIVPG